MKVVISFSSRHLLANQLPLTEQFENITFQFFRAVRRRVLL
jgi:hypothetical protein